MSGFDPELLRDVRTLEDVLEFLGDELDWPLGEVTLEDAVFNYEPEELGIPREQMPNVRLRQLRPLTASQPWGIFFIEFTGRRLPVTPLRRLLRALVTKKRATSDVRRTWLLDDLLFITTTDSGDSVELHLLAFFASPDGGAPEIRSLPWNPQHSPRQHLARLAWELLPQLAWPEEPTGDEWRSAWRAAFPIREGYALRSADQLSGRMAETAQVLRDRIARALDAECGAGPFSTLIDEVRKELVADITAKGFADMAAQTLVYGALTARVVDPEGFGASPLLTAVPLSNPFLAAFFEQVHGEVVALDLDAAGLEQLVADLRETQVEAILDQFGSTAAGGDPVIHFYETFLARYDHQQRVDVGAFYTPQPVVRCIVRLVDAALKLRFGLPAGVGDDGTWAEVCQHTALELPTGADPDKPFVSVIDPATGTGTFLVEWLRQARASYIEAHGAAGWDTHLRETVLPRVRGLELLLAPYAIAHLKTALEVGASAADEAASIVLLTDTLELPGPAARLEGLDPVASEGRRAAEVKQSGRPSIVVGNPPYRRATRAEAGGWVANGDGARPALMQDIIDVANARTIFSHVASLYNLYIYFWRWALWKAFEQPGQSPGAVGFITASSWLDGPGFVGLRESVRDLCSEVWIVDLGGDNRGTQREDNVFDIETPVAIAVLLRAQATDDKQPARILYRRISGTRAEKLGAVADVLAPDDQPEAWMEVESERWRLLKPAAGGDKWTALPKLTDLMPWQQPGAMLNRTWPVAPDARILKRRWSKFMTEKQRRAELFPDPRTGRRVDTHVQLHPTLASLGADAAPEPSARYAWRAFDRQWILDDPRLAALERPALWQAVSERQIFFASLASEPIGPGPALLACTAVPDKHVFRGSFGGKDVLPLYRDAAASQPNVVSGLLRRIAERLDRGGDHADDLTPEDLVAYLFALLSTPGYQARFAAELADKQIRVPFTAARALFDEAVRLGKELLWLQTFGERFRDEEAGRTAVPPAAPVDWEATPTTLPPLRSSVRYDAESERLHVGDGVIAAVRREIWTFEVSGWPVVQRWLEHRTAQGRGRRSSELDAIRPNEWHAEWTDELLWLLRALHRSIELQPAQDDLLRRILEGQLIHADELPEPTAAERAVPATIPKTPKGSLRLR